MKKEKFEARIKIGDLHKERYCGKYSRSFYIGCSDETKANAVYHNGVLTVVIPETCADEPEKGKYITIN